MLGILYLFLAVWLGKGAAAELLAGHKEDREAGNRLWLVYPAAFGLGVLIMSWGTYLISWFASVGTGTKNPLLYGNLVMMAGAGACFVYSLIKKYRTKEKKSAPPLIQDKKLFIREAAFFGALLVFLTWIMFYVFYIRDGKMYSGFTVFGDYAPHTAMMRSFSWGDNFPTQYPHFGGEDVKYHFMFQFLAGNLEYLGLRLDVAYNSISILSLLGFLMVLYKLAARLFGSSRGGFFAGALTVVLFFFRSGVTFFRFAWEHIQAGDLWQTLQENTSFIGYTPNENWGLWNFNVYLNQRHLAYGLLIVALVVWVYLDWVAAADAHEEKGPAWVKRRFFSREAWRCRSLETALLAGLFLGLCAFWNGAAVIGGLLVLLGFAVFSDGKLDYAVTAAVTIIFSLLQSKIFMRGSSMSLSFYWGLLAEDKSLLGVLWYLIQISGFFFVGTLVLVFLLKRRERMVLLGFLLPAVFAFTVSLTPDINVNHKYVMISYAFLAAFWAGAMVRLLKKGILQKVLAVCLVLCLTVTGVYDFVVILKDNDSAHRVTVDMDSALSRWLAENLDSEDLLLTPEYSMNEVTVSGVMLYCGWPYYAWSAGYDTNYRAAKAVEIYTGQDKEALMETVEQEGITYILFEEGMEFEEQVCREDVIAQAYPLVYRSEDGRIRIYEV